MALAPGTRLGAYEIISPLGAGGMGEVYRATDTRLKRSVAIKVLLPEVAQNSERLARFEREAQILASLNHPSIAAIYGVEQAGATTALILEFIDGPTLADRIARGPIPINEALPIANQVAEALEAAHEQGVIHRDLKPANIKVRPDGTVKVLDFGLAKALEPVSVGSTPLTNAPTITSPAMVTGAGMILGTAAYIAPEQARGKAVDRRADIWAFGCVLFEMLTGTRAFAGEDVADVLSRVLQREPELAALPAGTSPPVRTLIAHCLVKDPRHRLRDIGDARLALDGAFETPTPQATRSTALPASRERRALIAALSLAVLLILAMVGPTIRYLREPPPSSQPETRLDIVTPPASSTTGFALSPDGRKIAYVGTDEGIPRLWVRSLDSVVPQALPGTDNARNPFWSPDGRSLGFFAERKLKRIDLGGGQPQTLTEVTSETAQGAWNAEGTILFAQPVAGGPLFRISVSGGQPLAATTLRPGESGHWSPRFIAGGRQYIYASQGSIPALWLGSLDDSSAGQDHAAEPRRITAWNPDTESSGEYLAPNWLVQVRGRFLVAQRFDIGSGLLSGDAVTLAQVSTIDPATLTAAFSVSTSGAIAWRGGTGNSNQLIWFNRSGEHAGTLGAADDSGLAYPELSPDGKYAAVSRGVVGSRDLWLQEGTRSSRFTLDAADDLYAVWSPNGASVAFSSSRKGTYDLYQKAADGSGSEQLLVQSTDNKRPNAWSPDGRFLLYTSTQNGGDLMVLPLTAGERKPFPFVSTPFNEQQAVFSPDGKWVAYQSNESGRNEIYARPFPGPGGQWHVSTEGGMSPRWRADGKELYYVAPNGWLMAAAVEAAARRVTPGTPVALFLMHAAPQLNKQSYDVGRDGRFLVDTELQDSSAEPIHLLQNWHSPSK